jgi:hypothetical protein
MDRLAGKAETLKQEFIKLLTPRTDPGERAP